MIHFAKLESNNVVEKVVTLEDAVAKDSHGVVNELIGAAYLNNLEPGTWKQTYKTGTLQGIVNPRKNYAGIGDIYDSSRDAFIPPQVHSSLTLNEGTCLWEFPVDVPAGTQTSKWLWDETLINWVDENSG